MSRRLNDLEAPVGKPSLQRRIRTVVGALMASVSVAGCGNALYVLRVAPANTKLEEARELGAEHYATYEYVMAREHLLKARTEAAEADYGDAVDLAELARRYAERAIVLSHEAHRGAGR